VKGLLMVPEESTNMLAWFSMGPVPERTAARTYQLPRSVIGRLNAAAAAMKVWPSDLVAWLLERGLDAMDAGEVPPTEPAYRHIISREGKD